MREGIPIVNLADCTPMGSDPILQVPRYCIEASELPDVPVGFVPALLHLVDTNGEIGRLVKFRALATNGEVFGWLYVGTTTCLHLLND